MGLTAQINDDCSNAIFICQGYEITSGGNTGATTSTPDALSCGDGTPQKTVWYKVQGYGTGTIDVILDNVIKDGFEMEIFESADGTCNTLTAIPGKCATVSGTSAIPGDVTVSFSGTNGRVYYIMIDGKNSTEGLFHISTSVTSSLVGEASANFDLLGGLNALCANDTFFVANNTVENGGILTYTVNYADGNGFVGFNGANQYDTIVFDSVGEYNISYKIEHDNCNTSYDQFDVDVQELRVAIDTNNAYCPGFAINLVSKAQMFPNPSQNLLIDRYVWTITDACDTYSDTVIIDSVSAILQDTIQYIPCNDTFVVQLETYSNTCLPDTIIDTFYLYQLKVDAGNDTIICYGDSVQLTSTIVNSGISPYIYNWSPSDSFLISNISDPISVQLYDTNKYFVNVTDVHGCPATDSLSIIVNPKLSVDAGPKDTVCRGETAILNSTILDNGAGNITYQWSDPDSIGANSSAIASATPSSTDTFYLQVTDDNTCLASDSVIIQVSDVIVDAGSDTSICLGDSASLSVDTLQSIAILPFIYSWSSAVTLNDATIFDPMAGPVDTLKYFVTVTDQHACSVIDSVIVNVNKLDINVGSDTLICYGDTAQLNVDTTTSPGVSPYQFSWTPLASLDVSNIPNPQANPLATTEYNLAMTDAMGCVAKDTMLVDVNPELRVDAGNDTLICYGDTAHIVLDTSLNGTSPLIFSWAPTNDSLNALDSFEVFTDPVNATTYDVLVTDANSCTATDTITVNVNPDFKINIIPDTASIFVCAGDSFLLNVDTASIPGVPPYTYN